MRGSSSFFGTIFALALLAALLAGGYFLFKYVGGAFAALEPQLETLAAIASIVALICAVIIAEGLKARGLSERQGAAFREKTALYEALLASCAAGLRANGSDAAQTDDELRKLERLLILHGGNKVISAYVRFRRLPREGGKLGEDGPALLKTLAVEMRSDLGSLNAFRNDDDLLALLLDRVCKPTAFTAERGFSDLLRVATM